MMPMMPRSLTTCRTPPCPPSAPHLLSHHHHHHRKAARSWAAAQRWLVEGAGRAAAGKGGAGQGGPPGASECAEDGAWDGGDGREARGMWVCRGRAGPRVGLAAWRGLAGLCMHVRAASTIIWLATPRTTRMLRGQPTVRVCVPLLPVLPRGKGQLALQTSCRVHRACTAGMLLCVAVLYCRACCSTTARVTTRWSRFRPEVRYGGGGHMHRPWSTQRMERWGPAEAGGPAACPRGGHGRHHGQKGEHPLRLGMGA